MNFGERLKKLRIEKQLTQEMLANKLNLSKANISKYESGYLEPGLQTLVKIAEIFETTTDYLLENSEYRELSVTINDKNKRKIAELDSLLESMTDEQFHFYKKMLELTLTPKADLNKILKIMEILVSDK